MYVRKTYITPEYPRIISRVLHLCGPLVTKTSPDASNHRAWAQNIYVCADDGAPSFLGPENVRPRCPECQTYEFWGNILHDFGTLNATLDLVNIQRTEQSLCAWLVVVHMRDNMTICCQHKRSFGSE